MKASVSRYCGSAPDADEILRERLAHRHRRQQFLDAGGFQHLRVYPQPRQVKGIIAGGGLDQFQVGFVTHRILQYWPGMSANKASSAGTTDALLVMRWRLRWERPGHR